MFKYTAGTGEFRAMNEITDDMCWREDRRCERCCPHTPQWKHFFRYPMVSVKYLRLF